MFAGIDNRLLPCWIFTVAVVFFLIFSQLVQDGIFMDGLLYISVSKNLADGIGTFWDPHFSKTSMPSFHEQPPLYFGLLALFYKILGTSMYVERFFCFVCFTLTGVYIHKIWKKIYHNHADMANNSWLPVFIWSTIPVCFWAYANQVEETVMALFAVGAIYYIYCALFLDQYTVYHLVTGGFFIFLSSLTKGIQGLFPLAAILLYWLIFRKISFGRAIVFSAVLIGIPVIAYLSLLLQPQVLQSYKAYFADRLVSSLNNVGQTTTNRFELLERLLFELLPVLSLGTIFLFFTRKRKGQEIIPQQHTKLLCWFTAIGLSGSLPLMITLVQRGFYLVTALPFFAIAVAMWIAPRVTAITNKINPHSAGFKALNIAAITVLLTSICFFTLSIGKTKRDKELLTDIYALQKIIPKGETIGMPSEMWNYWSLHAYMVRYNYVSLDISPKKHQYFIIDKDLPKKLILEGYKIHPVPTRKIDLYVLKQACAAPRLNN